MTPSPAAVSYLAEINTHLGSAWALRLAEGMKEGFIVSIDGVDCMQDEGVKALPERKSPVNTHTQGGLW
jgi:hypothetical protein